jgi:hypothetical protein
MSDQTKDIKRRSKFWKWFIIPVVIILIIIGGLRWLIQSDLLLDYLRRTAEAEVNNRINGSLAVGNITGDLLNGIAIRDIVLLDESGDTVVTMDSVGISYSVMELIFQPHEVQAVSVDGLTAYGNQDEEGVWNFEKLIPPSVESAADESISVPFWKINELEINCSSVSVVTDFLPDGQLILQNLGLKGNAGYGGSGWSAVVEEFGFILEGTRFDQPSELEASANLEGEIVTLEKLLFNTGRSFIESRATYEFDQQIFAELEFSPLSWLDINSYIDIPLEQDINGRIGVEGSLSDLNLNIEASADGLEMFSITGRLHLDEEPSLSELYAEIRQFEGEAFTGDSLAPDIDSVDFTGHGIIIFDQPGQSQFSGELSLLGLSTFDYTFDDLQITFDWMENNLDAGIGLRHNDQYIEGNAEIRQLLDDLPAWSVSLASNDLNLALLLGDQALESRLNFTASAAGNGFMLSDERIALNASVFESQWGGQSISRAGFDGNLSGREITGFLDVGIDDSQIQSDFAVDNWQTEPVYTFSSELSGFNLADFNGLEEFPTNLNASIDGNGAWFDLERLDLNTSLDFDTSTVNDEQLETLQVLLEIRDQVAYVNDAELRSDIADANFSFRQHLVDFKDLGNTLDLETRIKNIQSFSPLLGVDSLQAGGQFTGHLSREGEGELRFDGSLQLSEIVYDTLFTIEAIEGRFSSMLLEEPVIDLDLDIRTPSVNGFALQSVNLNSRVNIRELQIDGNLGLDFIQDEENGVYHGGRFVYMENDLQLDTEDLEFRTPDRTLTLQRPFDFTIRENVIRMDTLHIRSPDENAYLKLAIPYLDEFRQEFILDASLLDLGTLQRSLFDELYVDALLSGHVDFLREEEEISAQVELSLSEIRYNSGAIDSLKLSADIADQRMLVAAGAWYDQNELLRINGNIPFEPGDPLTFDDEFFEQPVEGEVLVPSTSIGYWKDFLEGQSELEADGLVSFSSTIGGTAGDPVFTGRFNLREGNLSGVAIDSVNVGIEYSHENSNIRFEGDVNSLGTQIADFEALLPLYLDLRAFNVDLPQDTDEVFVYFNSEDLNLAILNNFLDRDQLRDLRGRLTGNVELQGPIASLEPNGNIRVRNGSVRVIPAGITLTDISSDMNIRPDMIELGSFTMQSGPGRLNASGSIELMDMEPGNVSFTLQATQFRAYNTADVNAIVDLNSRLQGNFQRPQLTGSLHFLSGFINLQNFGEEAVEDVRLEDDPDPVNIAFYDSVAVEMNVIFDRQFFIRNRQYLDMEIELAGEIDLVKQAGADPEMFGSMEGVRGYARPLGRNFELEEAVVTFYGPVGNPQLNIRTVHSPPQVAEEISIWYIIEGTVEDPEFRFDSEPFLELQDIISYTLFGRPFYALESWQQAVSGGGRGTTAADVALDLILDRFETLAAQQLGIDVVQIDTDRTGSSNSTTIKTGWYLTDRTFFAVLNEISGTTPKTMFMLEYMIRRNLELIITQGDDTREGIDLRWKYDY